MVIVIAKVPFVLSARAVVASVVSTCQAKLS
jgi:hypothetical protein